MKKICRFAILLAFVLLPVIAASAAPEPARSADAFVDAIGVNVHIHDGDTTYGHFDDIIQPRLLELGVRHIRDGAVDTTWHPFYDRLNGLGKRGIKCLYITGPRDVTAIGDKDRDFLVDFARRVPDSLEAYEGPNEYDIDGNHKGDAHWAQTLQQFQTVLYDTVKTPPALKGVAVLGPTLGMNHDYGHPPVPDMGAVVDYGNAHPYPFGGNPFSDRAGYDTIDWYIGHGNYPGCNLDEATAAFDNARPMFVGKPLIFTETGYFTGTKPGAVSEAVFAKYIPRLVAETFLHGVARTYLYELADIHDNPGDDQSNFGLIHADGSPKAAYTNLKNLIRLLAEPGVSPKFQPHPLDFTMSVSPVGDYTRTQYVHHLLLQKSDGAYFLLLWHEISDEDIAKYPHRPLTPPDMPATITLPPAIQRARLFRPYADMAGTLVTLTGHQISLNVPDQVIVLKLSR